MRGEKLMNLHDLGIILSVASNEKLPIDGDVVVTGAVINRRN